MIPRFAWLLAAPGLLACAAVSYAQNSDDVQAPPSVHSPKGSPEVYAISLSVYPDWKRGNGVDDEKWRRAEPVDAVESYFSGTDAGFAEVLANPEQPRLFTNLDLTVSANGHVIGCTVSPEYSGQAELAPLLCPVATEKLRFLPALDKARAPIPDQVRLHFAAGPRLVRPGQSEPAVRGRDNTPSQAPPYLPNFRSAKDWPPSSRWGLDRSLIMFRNPDAIELATIAPDIGASDKSAGLTIFTLDYETPQCETVMSSGDPAFDERACHYVMKKADPYFRGKDYSSRSGYPLLVTGEKKPERVIAPVPGHVKWVSQSDEVRSAFLAEFLPAFEAAGGDRDRLSLRFRVGVDGRASDCSIRDSSGSTEADILACEIVERALVYEPAIDAFGRVRDDARVWWRVPNS